MSEVSAPPAISLVKPRQFAGFNGLRAIAVVCVVVLHTAAQSRYSIRAPLGFLTARGDVGVTIFFLISGFLLYRPFAVSNLAGLDRPNPLRYFERRLLRIIPAYWLALTVLSVMGQISLGGGWQGLVSHYFFLQIYFPQEIFSGITPAWSLCTEMSFYLFLPFYAAAIGYRRKTERSQLRRELIGIAGMFVISFGVRFWLLSQPIFKAVNGHVVAICKPHCSTNTPLSSLVSTWLPARIDLFGAGMLIALLSAWYAGHRNEPRFLSNRWMPSMSWLLAICAFVVSGLLITDHHIINFTSLRVRMLAEPLSVFTAFFLIVPAVFGPQDRSVVRWLLRCWPVASLGVVSYGIYLWHLNIMFMVRNFIRGHHYWMTFFHVFAPTLALATLVATISYFVVEKPALRLKGRLAWWSSPSAATEDRSQ